jgi:hypothetical protein
MSPSPNIDVYRHPSSHLKPRMSHYTHPPFPPTFQDARILEVAADDDTPLILRRSARLQGLQRAALRSGDQQRRNNKECKREGPSVLEVQLGIYKSIKLEQRAATVRSLESEMRPFDESD